MALTDENGGNGMVMPVAPLNGNYGNGGFGDCFGGNGFWIILLFLLIGGGWNNGWGGGFGGNVMADMYPWMNQQNQINDGFRDQMLNTTINGIQNSVISGFGDVQNSLCGGFAGVTAAINGSQNATAQQLYTNQIADLERSFAAQTANTAGMSALQAQLAQCCCDNKASTNELRYTVATEACADRAAVGDALQAVTAQGVANTNALMTTITGGIQSIKDQLCQDKIDAKNEEIANLRQQVNMQSLAASQAAQTAQLIADNTAQTQYVVNRVAPYPVPSYNVPNPYGTGCGCGVNAGCGF